MKAVVANKNHHGLVPKLQAVQRIHEAAHLGVGWDLVKDVQKRAKDEIKIGDMIITSGENNNFPKNMPIGFVSGIRGLDYETSLELDLEPVIDFSRLENVFVLVMNAVPEEEN